MGLFFLFNTTAPCGLHRYFAYCVKPPTSLSSDNTQTWADQQWNGFQDSARIQYQRSMCWQLTKHFDLSQSAEKQSITCSSSSYLHLTLLAILTYPIIPFSSLNRNYSSRCPRRWHWQREENHPEMLSAGLLYLQRMIHCTVPSALSELHPRRIWYNINSAEDTR